MRQTRGWAPPRSRRWPPACPSAARGDRGGRGWAASTMLCKIAQLSVEVHKVVCETEWNKRLAGQEPPAGVTDVLAPGGGRHPQTCLSCHIPPKICNPNPVYARCTGVRQLKERGVQQLEPRASTAFTRFSAFGAVFWASGRLSDCDVPTESLRSGVAATLRLTRGWGHQSAGAGLPAAHPAATVA